MFRRIDQAVQEFSNHVSRRGFLDGLGRTALAAATAMGGFLAMQSQAHAKPKGNCCMYDYPDEPKRICRLRKGQRTCPEGWIRVPCALDPPFCDEIPI